MNEKKLVRKKEKKVYKWVGRSWCRTNKKESNGLCNPFGTDKTSLMPKVMYYVQCILTPVKQQAMRSWRCRWCHLLHFTFRSFSCGTLLQAIIPRGLGLGPSTIFSYLVNNSVFVFWRWCIRRHINRQWFSQSGRRGALVIRMMLLYICGCHGRLINSALKKWRRTHSALCNNPRKPC